MEILSKATAADIAGAKSQVAVLPIGSFEQHGDVLPLATDTLIACGIAEALTREYGLFLLPPITVSCSHEHAAWPGTVSISSATLHRVVNDIVDSLRRSGVSKLVLVNAHGGNYVLANIVQELSVDGPNLALFPGRDDWNKARADAGLETSAHEDMHAGEIETSMLLHLLPEVVGPTQNADHDGSDRRQHLLTLGMRSYTTSGIIGKPSLGDATKGKMVLESLTQSFADYLRVLAA
ncbi:creatinine amidohydrolase [Rhizocola hellebori]|uniref:Creatinine amidohydrolase n=1 Tax=Rhizocola hellebori TaxID=1392758 RepID=A0A8J3Q3U8_9ACTN|nr:creatininase family protein [Rhizocola hellebori]GIH03254.1 creatinine amidohydrolase [Rhizocola hellebori]